MSRRGRPPSYRAEFVALLAEHRSEGGTITAFSGILGVTRVTLWSWALAYPAFGAAMRGKIPDAPVHPPVDRPTAQPAFSIGAWGVPAPGLFRTPHRSPAITEDDVDDMLNMAAAA